MWSEVSPVTAKPIEAPTNEATSPARKIQTKSPIPHRTAAGSGVSPGAGTRSGDEEEDPGSTDSGYRARDRGRSSVGTARARNRPGTGNGARAPYDGSVR